MLNSVFDIFRSIFLSMRHAMLSVELLPGVTWWHLFCGIWVLGIFLFALGFLFKLRGSSK